MMPTRSVLYRMLFLVPISMSLLFGISACGSSTANTPLTYDSVTGRISSSMITVGAKVSLVNSAGKTLWDNPNYAYREQYQVSRDVGSFFDEANPAFLRVAREFAKSLVSNILEAY